MPSFHQDEMQLQLPVVVGKKGTEEEKLKEDVDTKFERVGWRWDQQRGEAELRMEEGVLTDKEERQVKIKI